MPGVNYIDRCYRTRGLGKAHSVCAPRLATPPYFDVRSQVSEIVLTDMQYFIKEGSWSVGRLAFFGGAYAAVVGVLALMPPKIIFRVFSPLAGVNMIALTLFGFVTMTVESDGNTISATFKANIIKYCAALDEIWGRGLFYLYIGMTQILGPNEKLFGWYMCFVGGLMLFIYRLTSKHMARLGDLLAEPGALEAAFDKYSGEDGVLNRPELCKLLADMELELSHAELEMMFKRLDPDHDGYVSLPELQTVLKDHVSSHAAYYTVGPVPKLDPSKGDALQFSTGKKKPILDARGRVKAPDEKPGGVMAMMDWGKVKRTK